MKSGKTGFMKLAGLWIVTVLTMFFFCNTAFALSGPRDADVIYLTKSGDQRTYSSIRVQTDEYTGVRLQGNIMLDPTDIVMIIPVKGNARFFGEAIKLYYDGDHAQALEKLTSSKALLKDREWVDIYYAFYKGMCLIQRGDKTSIELGLKELTKFENRAWSKSRFAPMALAARAQANWKLGNKPVADRLYGQLISNRYNDIWTLRGRMGQGEVFLSYGKSRANEAIKLFNQVITAARGKDRASEIKATMLKGKALVLREQYSEAEPLFDGIVKKSKGISKEVMAGAYNGLGDCYRAKGGKENLRKALHHYMHVVVLYASIRSEYARALYLAAKCLEESGDRKDMEKARKLKEELKKRCPDSKWAKQS